MTLASTSLEAFDRYQPHQEVDKLIILDCMSDTGFPVIPEDVVALTGLPLVTVRSRFYDLKNEGKIEWVGKKQNANGNNCRSYKLRDV